MPPLKLLSLWAPWYHFVVKGWKSVENRDWRYPTRYRGPVWIHAALKSAPGCMDIVEMVFGADEYQIPNDAKLPTHEDFEAVAGHIVGKARIVNVAFNTKAECAANPWAEEGLLGIRLADMEELATPIPWKGGQGLVDVDPAMVELVQRIAAMGHKLDNRAVPVSFLQWWAQLQHDGVDTKDVIDRAVAQKQLRREGGVLFTRAYKDDAPPEKPTPGPAPLVTSQRQGFGGW